ncbi:MAG: SPOR domain-containing protein [Caulobacteraceae bacterium]|nr:SPOR domain-containing protein [Caulobacter sp.]
MTEYDRGAYTPHADAPLAFDPRSPRERRPVPMTLVASGAILAVLCGAVVMAYRHHGGLGGEPRTVGAPVGSVKTVAAADATPKDPATTLDVYAPQNVTAAPAFAPAPEEPAARPAPRVQVQAAADTPVRIETPPPATVTTTTTRTEVAPAPVAVAKASGAPATAIPRGAADNETRTITPPAAKPQAVAAAPAKPTTTTASKPATAVAKAPAHAGAMTVASIRETDATIDAALARSAHPAAAKPVATKAAVAKAAAPATAVAKVEAKPATAVKTAAATAAPAGSGNVVVQIGAYNSTAIADTQFAAAKAAVGGGHGKAVSPVVVGGKTLYRTAFTGFADKAAAKAFCGKLTAAGHACIVKG